MRPIDLLNLILLLVGTTIAAVACIFTVIALLHLIAKGLNLL